MDATGVTGKVVAWGFIFDNYVLTLHKHVCSTANSFFKYALDDFNRGVVMMGGGSGWSGPTSHPGVHLWPADHPPPPSRT